MDDHTAREAQVAKDMYGKLEAALKRASSAEAQAKDLRAKLATVEEEGRRWKEHVDTLQAEAEEAKRREDDGRRQREVCAGAVGWSTRQGPLRVSHGVWATRACARR